MNNAVAHATALCFDTRLASSGGQLYVPHPPHFPTAPLHHSPLTRYFAVYWPRDTRLNLPLAMSAWFTMVRNAGETVR